LLAPDATVSEFELVNSFSSGQVATPLENGSEQPKEKPSPENNGILPCVVSLDLCCSVPPFCAVYLTIIPECSTDDVCERLGSIFPHVGPHQGIATETLSEKNFSQDLLVWTWEEMGRSA